MADDTHIYSFKEAITHMNWLLSQWESESITIRSLGEVTADMFVSLYHKIIGELPEDVCLPVVTQSEHVRNLQAVIDSLAVEVLRTSLRHIDAIDIASGDEQAIANLIEVFALMMEHLLYVAENRGRPTITDAARAKPGKDHIISTSVSRVTDASRSRHDLQQSANNAVYEQILREKMSLTLSDTARATRGSRSEAGRHSETAGSAHFSSGSAKQSACTVSDLNTEELIALGIPDKDFQSRLSDKSVRSSLKAKSYGISTRNSSRQTPEDKSPIQKPASEPVRGQDKVYISDPLPPHIKGQPATVPSAKVDRKLPDNYDLPSCVLPKYHPSLLVTSEDAALTSWESFPGTPAVLLRMEGPMERLAAQKQSGPGLNKINKLEASGRSGRKNKDKTSSKTSQQVDTSKDCSPTIESIDLVSSESRHGPSYSISSRIAKSNDSSAGRSKFYWNSRQERKQVTDEIGNNENSNVHRGEGDAPLSVLESQTAAKWNKNAGLQMSSLPLNCPYQSIKTQASKHLGKQPGAKTAGKADKGGVKRSEFTKNAEGALPKHVSIAATSERPKKGKSQEKVLYDDGVRKSVRGSRRGEKRSAIRPHSFSPYGKRECSNARMRERRKSSSESPPRKSHINDDLDSIFPILEGEFPGLHLSRETQRNLWHKYSQQVKHMMDTEKRSANNRWSKSELQLQESVKRQELLLHILRKEFDHEERLENVKASRELDFEVKRRVRDEKQRSARLNRYYNDFQTAQARLQHQNDFQEESLLKGLAADEQKHALMQLRKSARMKSKLNVDMEEKEARTLEEMYKQHFQTARESLKRQRMDTAKRERQQRNLVNEMQQDIRHMRDQMESEVKENREHTEHRRKDAMHFKKLEAEKQRRKIYTQKIIS